MLSRAASTARAARSLLQRARRGEFLRSRSSSIAASPTEPEKRRAIDSPSALPATAAASAQLALDSAAAAAATVAATAPPPPPTEENPAASTSSTASSLDEHFMRLALGQARSAASRGEVPVGALLVSRDGRTVLAAAGNGVEGIGDATAHAELLCLQRAAAEAAAEASAEAEAEASRAGGGVSSSAAPSSPLLPSSSAAATTATTPWPRSATAGSTLYVTLEPCAMCAGAALLARVGRIVYGARNAGAGADGSWVSLLPRESCSLEEGGERGREGREGRAADEGGDSDDDDDALSYPSLLTPLPARPHPSHPALEVTRGVLAGECGVLLKEFFRRRRAEGTRGSGGGGGVERGGGDGV